MKIFGFNRNMKRTKITILGIKFSIKHDPISIVSKNYTRKLTELQKTWGGGGRKIRIGFLVNEPAKWQYQSLYEQLEQSDYFEPVVLVTQLLLNHEGRQNFYKTIDDCFAFFESKHLNVRYVYDIQNKKYTASEDFNVDILFYQQPWEVDDSQHPFRASKTALTCYVPYGLHLVEFFGSYMSHFHQLLWLMFVEDANQIQRFSKLVNAQIFNCAVVGYPKLDAYFSANESIAISSVKPVLIYAPHHSVEASSLGCATFQTTGLAILALAQKYQEQIYWIFKPHPRFKTAVISNGIMSEQEITDYYSEWEKIGTIYDSGDYIGLFKQSSGMITDCISFLGEYLPSGNPLFHLLADKRPFNDFAKSFIDSYYQIEDIKQLDEALHRVIIEHQDEKREERQSKIPLLFDEKEQASTKIVQKLIDLLGGLPCKPKD